MSTAVKVKVNSTDGHSNGDLARQHRVHTFGFQFLREALHESFVFTSSTFSFRRKSRRKASFPHLQLSVFEEGLARNAF